MDQFERKLARVKRAEIGDVYNGMLGLLVLFEYDGGGSTQGLGSYMLDASFVIRFVRAIGAETLNQCIGRSSSVSIIEPLHKQDGQPFVIAEWQEWVKRRMPPLSYSELETGVDPNVRRATAVTP